MKEPAQAAYEKYTETFGIDTPQIRKDQSTINGSIPWDELPEGSKQRWRIAIHEAMNVQQANALASATQIAKTWKGKDPIVKEQPSETYVCDKCGASLMKGENHDCAKCVETRRALGHKLPGDK